MSKAKVSITIDSDLIEWIDKKVKEDYRFANRSHFINYVLNEWKKEKKLDTQH